MKIKSKNKKAFSLVEMIIAMFIFVLMMMVVVSVFVTMVKVRRDARVMQKNMESIRGAVESMAKNIRMSAVDDNSDSEIYIYNYSQDKCMHYVFSGDNISYQETSAGTSRVDNSGNKVDCKDDVVYGSVSNLISADVKLSGKFKYTASGSSLGKMTISMWEKDNANTQDRIQTTVSLRDYSSVL